MIQYSRTPMSNHGDNEAYLRGVYDATVASSHGEPLPDPRASSGLVQAECPCSSPSMTAPPLSAPFFSVRSKLRVKYWPLLPCFSNA